MSYPKFVFPYTVRRSPRTRYVRFIVSASGLEVVVPREFKINRDLPQLLETKREWITGALEKVRTRALRKEATKGLPETVTLSAIGEKWRVVLAPLTTERMTAQHGVIQLTSDYGEAEAVVALRRWILLKGKRHLPPILRELADLHSLQVARISVKEQKSLWGSCSSKGNVNLNSRLLFLPPHLVRHVMLHELCHLKEMNHSKAFHALLETLDPEAARHTQELKQAWDLIPGWVLRD